LIVSGKTIIGGLVGGFIAVHILKKRLNLNVKTGNDIAAPAALGMAIGRLGCLFGGCCYGMESPEIFGIKFGDGTYRYPTQIYEIIFDLGLFVFFMYLKNNKTLKPGILFRYLLNSYLIFRFLVEFLRESDRLALGISYYQIICLLCVIFINRTYIINAIKGKHIKVRLEN
jgi:prolipoprotein diacylglyceryltransferase